MNDEKEYYLKLVSNIKESRLNKLKVWEDAYLLYDILKTEQYKNEFDTKEAFAKYLNISRPMLIKYEYAVDFAKKHDIDKSVIGIDKAYLFNSLGHRYKQFVEECYQNEIDVQTICTNELKKIIPKYKNGESIAEITQKNNSTSEKIDKFTHSFNEKHYISDYIDNNGNIFVLHIIKHSNSINNCICYEIYLSDSNPNHNLMVKIGEKSFLSNEYDTEKKQLDALSTILKDALNKNTDRAYNLLNSANSPLIN